MGPTEAGVSEAPSKRPPAFRESLQRLLSAAAPASGASKEPTTDRSTEAEESAHAGTQQGGVPATTPSKASQEADVATQHGKEPVLTPGSSVKVQEAPAAASPAPASAVHMVAKTTPGLLLAQKKETTGNVAEGMGPSLLFIQINRRAGEPVSLSG